jgi:hypothetical protein
MSVHTAAGQSRTGAAVEAAADVLSRRLGARVELTPAEDATEPHLGAARRRVVVRAQVASTPFDLPKTLVVTQYGAGRDAAESFASEAVSYQLFNALAEDSRMCPELLAHGADERVLVLEDLGRVPTLREILFGRDGKAAERALLSFARSLGKLHAVTASADADFAALSRRLHVDLSTTPLAGRAEAARAAVPALLYEVLGVRALEVQGEVTERTKWLTAASKRRALSPADPCPESALLTDKGIRFPDFDGARVREVALDAASLRVPFPACDSAYALPHGMSEAMVASWRAEVAGVWPELGDDRVLDADLFDAQLLWVWLSSYTLLTRVARAGSAASDDVGSPSTAGRLVARWRSLAERAAEQGAEEIADLAQQVAHSAAGRSRMPDEPAPFPAFR